jgi:hypothetical protein
MTAGTGGAGGSASGSGGGAGAAVACNELPADAPEFMMTTDPNPAPAARGGVITDGTYFAMGQIWYEQSGSFSLAYGGVRVEIGGDTWEEVEAPLPSDPTGEPRHRTSALTVSSPTLTLTRTCPSPGAPESTEYTVDGDDLTLYITDAGSVFGTTFRRQ